jgi:hypothetical protein
MRLLLRLRLLLLLLSVLLWAVLWHGEGGNLRRNPTQVF